MLSAMSVFCREHSQHVSSFYIRISWITIHSQDTGVSLVTVTALTKANTGPFGPILITNINSISQRGCSCKSAAGQGWQGVAVAKATEAKDRVRSHLLQNSDWSQHSQKRKTLRRLLVPPLQRPPPSMCTWPQLSFLLNKDHFWPCWWHIIVLRHPFLKFSSLNSTIIPSLELWICP